MSAPIFVIRLLSTPAAGKREASSSDPVEWMLFQDGEPVSSVGHCAFSEVFQLLEEHDLVYNARIVLLLPAEDVVLTRVTIPANQKRQRNKLVPFILEEHLNQNVSDVFFVTEWLPKTGEVGVAYMARERLDQWLALFEEQKLKPDVVFPEQYLLPYQENHIFAIFDKGRVLTRHDAWVSSVTPVGFAQEWVSRVVQDAASMPDPESELPFEAAECKVRLLLDRHDVDAVDASLQCEKTIQAYASEYQAALRKSHGLASLAPAELPVRPAEGVISSEDLVIGPQAGIHVKRLVVAQPITQVLATEAVRLVTEHHHFQMLQLDYKTARRKRKSKYQWQAAAGLFVGLMVFQLGLTFASTQSYESAYTELRRENIETFKAVFPNVKRIRGSLRRALSSQLARNKDLAGGIDFLDLVMTTGSTLVNAKGLVIQRMSYDASQGGLRVDLQVADYPDLEKIQKDIEAQSLQVKIDGANKDKEGVKARLRIGVS